MAADPQFAIVASVIAAHALAVASPGPDFAIVLRQSLARGRRAGMRTALGIASGIVIHVAYGLYGLAWLLRVLPAALQLIAIAGALLLIALGVQSLRTRASPADQDAATPEEATASNRDWALGFATNVLNPKASLFFVALFSSLVSAPLSGVVQAALALWLPLATFAWFAMLAGVVTQPRVRRVLHQQGTRIDRAMGVVLIGLGVLVLWREMAVLVARQ